MTDTEIIQKVSLFLDSDIEVQSVFNDLVPYRVPLLTMRCRLYKELLKAREQYRHPKDKEYTDFDRKTMLEAHVAELQEQYELAKGLEELVKQRIDLTKHFN